MRQNRWSKRYLSTCRDLNFWLTISKEDLCRTCLSKTQACLETRRCQTLISVKLTLLRTRFRLSGRTSHSLWFQTRLRLNSLGFKSRHFYPVRVVDQRTSETDVSDCESRSACEGTRALVTKASTTARTKVSPCSLSSLSKTSIFLARELILLNAMRCLREKPKRDLTAGKDQLKTHLMSKNGLSQVLNCLLRRRT